MEFFGGIWCYISEFFQSDTFITLVTGGIGALIGTVAGVSFGFWLNKKWELERELEKEIYAGRNAQYSLLRQYELLYNINEVHLKGLRENPDPGTDVRIIQLDYNFPKVDITSLFFMLDKKGPEIVHQVDMQNRRFWTFASILISRNDYMEYLQRTLSKDEITGLQHKLLNDRVKNLLGAYEVAMNEIKTTLQLLFDCLSKWYPGKTILTMEDIDKREEELERHVEGN